MQKTLNSLHSLKHIPDNNLHFDDAATIRCRASHALFSRAPLSALKLTFVKQAAAARLA
jgi:hypothetical protein